MSSCTGETDEEEKELLAHTSPASVALPVNYDGVTCKLPMTSNQLEAIIDGFRNNKVKVPVFTVICTCGTQPLCYSLAVC